MFITLITDTRIETSLFTIHYILKSTFFLNLKQKLKYHLNFKLKSLIQ